MIHSHCPHTKQHTKYQYLLHAHFCKGECSMVAAMFITWGERQSAGHLFGPF